MSETVPQRQSYDELAVLVAVQAARIAELEAELAELKRRLRMDSSNSSKPPSSDGVRDLLRSAPVLGADETPAWVDEAWKYVHVACTDKLTLCHAGSRTKDAIDSGGVLAGFTGALMRDGYAGYDHIDTAVPNAGLTCCGLSRRA